MRRFDGAFFAVLLLQVQCKIFLVLFDNRIVVNAEICTGMLPLSMTCGLVYLYPS